MKVSGFANKPTFKCELDPKEETTPVLAQLLKVTGTLG